MIKIKIHTNVDRVLPAKAALIRARLDAAIRRAAFMLQGEIRESISGHRAEPASVDTGNFLDHIGVEFPQMFQAIVYSPTSYAVFLEYGTSKGMKPRHHFTNSALRMEPIIIENVRESIRDI